MPPRYDDRVNPDALLVAYITFALLLAATPGATTAVVVRSTLRGGRPAGFAAAAGAALANTSIAAAAGLGLAVAVVRLPAALPAIRVVGAAYLAWLGAASLWRFASRRAREPEAAAIAGTGAARNRSTSFRHGLATNMLNPVTSTFYLAVVPTFVPSGAPRWHYAVLAAIHVVLAFTCHSAWSMAFARLRQLFRRPWGPGVLEAVSGAALLALAARMVASP